MKTSLPKPVELKAFTIGVGTCVGFLVLCFLITFYSDTKDKIYNRTSKPAPAARMEPVYTEVRGMH